MIYKIDPPSINQELNNRVQRYFKEGWRFHTISADYKSLDGAIIVFKKVKQKSTKNANNNVRP